MGVADDAAKMLVHRLVVDPMILVDGRDGQREDVVGIVRHDVRQHFILHYVP